MTFVRMEWKTETGRFPSVAFDCEGTYRAVRAYLDNQAA